MKRLKTIKTFEELPLVLQLQHLAQKSDSDIEELLRRAKLVAMKLKLADFEAWCDLELMGYKDLDDLPDYRITTGNLFIWNPSRGLMPFRFEDSQMYEAITTVKLFETVGQYLNLIKVKPEGLTIQLPNNVLDYLYSIQKRHYGFCLEPRLNIAITQILNVFTHVRNTIFNWSVNLEKIGILGDGMQFTREEKEKAMSNTVYNIGNLQGIAGQVMDSTITQTNQMIVNKMDLSTLLTTLKCAGISDNDLDNLKIALEQDENPIEKNKFGSNVSSWYGDMISKAATGSWDISVAVAAGILTQVLNNFYGL